MRLCDIVVELLTSGESSKMNFAYIWALIVMYALFALGIFLMKYIRNHKAFNLIFPVAVFALYFALCIFVYKTDTDPARWNFLNTLPTANISPFTFSIMPLLLVLPKKAKEPIYLLIAMMSVGMFFSVAFGCLGNAVRNYRFHPHFLLDYMAHVVLAAYGVYLIRSKTAKFSVKNCLVSGSLIYGVAVVMLILNVIFDKAFFGLSLNSSHNIYNMVLVDNSYLSALIYFIGLGAVLALGALLCAILNRERFSIVGERK